MSKRNGGSAFPIYTPDMNVDEDAGPGMTLRDWFAAQALSGQLAFSPADPFAKYHQPEDVAKVAYQMADAMLAERSKPFAADSELLEAAKAVLAGLEARIDNAPNNAVPVFAGIAALHDAIAKAEGRS